MFQHMTTEPQHTSQAFHATANTAEGTVWASPPSWNADMTSRLVPELVKSIDGQPLPIRAWDEIEVAPWADDETSMERADRALSELGWERVGSWSERQPWPVVTVTCRIRPAST